MLHRFQNLRKFNSANRGRWPALPKALRRPEGVEGRWRQEAGQLATKEAHRGQGTTAEGCLCLEAWVWSAKGTDRTPLDLTSSGQAHV